MEGSVRSIKRAARGFTKTRHAKRAERRLAGATANYTKFGGKMPESGFAMHKPGSIKPW